MSGCESQACHHLELLATILEMAVGDHRLTISSFMCSLSVWLILDCHQSKCHLMAVGLRGLCSCASCCISDNSKGKSQAWDGLL